MPNTGKDENDQIFLSHYILFFKMWQTAANSADYLHKIHMAKSLLVTVCDCFHSFPLNHLCFFPQANTYHYIL